MVNPNLKVEDHWNHDRKWNETVVKNVFDNSYDVEDICKIYISLESHDDKRTMPFSKSGQLTRRSACRVIIKGGERNNSPLLYWKDFW